jgi:hypothetical protein
MPDQHDHFAVTIASPGMLDKDRPGSRRQKAVKPAVLVPVALDFLVAGDGRQGADGSVGPRPLGRRTAVL